MEGRTVRCSIGDRILGEGTNQQIRVLNLNRRPNINSRPVSPTVVAAATAPRHAGFSASSRSVCPACTVFLVSLTRSSLVLRYNQCRTYATDTPDLWYRLAPKRYLRATFRRNETASGNAPLAFLESASIRRVKTLRKIIARFT